MLTLTCCQDLILTENIWFVCLETSYSRNERRCHRCGTTERTTTITEDRATQPMEAGGWVSQLDFDEAAESRHCRPFGDEGDNCCQSQGFQVLQIMCSAFLNYLFVIMYLVFQMTYLYLCIWNRVDIWHDRCDRRSCKILVSCVNLSENNANFAEIVPKNKEIVSHFVKIYEVATF